MMLGQLPGMDLVSPIVSLTTPSPVTPGPPVVPVPDCSTWDFFFNAPAWRSCQTAKEAAASKQVAVNAAYYYGPNSPSAQAAAQAAADVAAQAPADQGNVADYYSAGSVAATPGQGMPTWAMAALLIGGLLLLKNMNS
jgi:hypothetical protein